VKPSDPTRRLMRVIAACQHHESELVRSAGQDLLRWWYEGGRQPMERVLGLRSDPGQRSPQTQAMLVRRDDLVRKASVQYHGLSANAVAKAMHRAWSRYATSSWPRERGLGDVPPRIDGKPEALFWQIMRIEDRVLSERSIRRILATS
jgi:hypothetical protein